MMSPFGSSGRSTPADWSRRNLLQVGAVGALGLGLPQFLTASEDSRAAKQNKRSPKSCIFIVQYGGASHLDSLDLKPGAPSEVRGPDKPIATTVPAMHLCELMPRLARLADRYCIVRSMSHPNAAHDGGMHVCMTGHTNP